MANKAPISKAASLVILVTLVIPVVLLSASPSAWAQAQAQGEGDAVLDTALRFFTRHDAPGVLERLESVRPAPVSLAERERVLATLPAAGRLRTSMPASGGSSPRCGASSNRTDVRRSM
jgi:hypothetical protein